MTLSLLFYFYTRSPFVSSRLGRYSVSVPGDEEVFAGGKGIRAANSFVLWLEGYLVSALVYTCFCSVTYPGGCGSYISLLNILLYLTGKIRCVVE